MHKNYTVHVFSAKLLLWVGSWWGGLWVQDDTVLQLTVLLVLVIPVGGLVGVMTGWVVGVINGMTQEFGDSTVWVVLV